MQHHPDLMSEGRYETIEEELKTRTPLEIRDRIQKILSTELVPHEHLRGPSGMSGGDTSPGEEEHGEDRDEEEQEQDEDDQDQDYEEGADSPGGSD